MIVVEAHEQPTESPPVHPPSHRRVAPNPMEEATEVLPGRLQATFWPGGRVPPEGAHGLWGTEDTTETVAALTCVAFTVCGVDRLEIHVDPANEISCRIPRRLGYAEEATLRRRIPPLPPESSRRDVVVFTLLAEEFRASPLASLEIAAYDSAGGRMLEGD